MYQDHLHLLDIRKTKRNLTSSSKPRYKNYKNQESLMLEWPFRKGGGGRLKVKENKSSAFPFEIRIFLFHIKGKLDRGR